MVEVHGAIFRMVRAGNIEIGHEQDVLNRLERLTRTWWEIEPEHEVRELAMKVSERHALRAADAFQLSAALVWCKQRASKRHFLCGDRRLGRAAEIEGFTVVDVRRP